MTPTEAAALSIGATFFIQLIGIAFIYGGLNSTVKSHGERIEAIEADDSKQWDEINKHTSDIGYIKGRLNGKAAHG